MSSGKKKHRAVIRIPDIEQVITEDSDVEYAQDMIDFHCGYDCYAYDCGLDCPDDCPILRYYDILNHHQRQEEQDVLKSLGLSEV